MKEVEMKDAVVIVWVDNAYDGWSPKCYATDADASQAIASGLSYGARYVVTRPVQIRVEITK